MVLQENSSSLHVVERVQALRCDLTYQPEAVRETRFYTEIR